MPTDTTRVRIFHVPLVVSIGVAVIFAAAWSPDASASEASALHRDTLSELDEPCDLGAFTLDSPANGGQPVVLECDVSQDGFVTGFHFAGSVSGVSGTSSWASDACMVVEAPSGMTFSVGGAEGTHAGCGPSNYDGPWDFQGESSAEDGAYESLHDSSFETPIGETGTWTFTFVNDWDHAAAATMAWTDVVVTLLTEEVIDMPLASIGPASFSFDVEAGGSAQETLTIGNAGDMDLEWAIDEAGPAEATLDEVWLETFDDYAAGSDIHGQGGWAGWNNSPGAGALVSDEQARTGPHSLDIVGSSDPVREFDAFSPTSGQWTLTAWQYIPESYTGQHRFIILNQYDQDSNLPRSWSVTVEFNSSSDQIINDGNSGGALPLIRGEWVEVRIEIDLDNDTQEFFYGGEPLYSGSWRQEISSDGILALDAIDLYANSATSVFYDDISIDNSPLATCDAPGDVAWLSATPDTGTTLPDSEESVTIAVDGSDLEPDVYTARLCVTTNDPNQDLVDVPVTMTVDGIVSTEASHDELETALSAPRPNPVRGTASFSFTVERSQHVTVDVFDATGRRLKTLYDGRLSAGLSESLSLDASALPVGVYVIRAVGEHATRSRTVTIVR